MIAVVRNGGGQKFDELSKLAFTLSEDVSASLDKFDLVLINTSTATPVDLTAAIFSYDSGTNTATWDLTGAVIDLGFHTATLTAAGITDAAGAPLDGNNDGTGGDDFVTTEADGFPLLVALPGDTDLDGDVDATDIQNILAAISFDNPAGRPYTWFQGDFNDDGDVGAIDIQLILATNAFGADAYAATSEPATDATFEPIEFSAPGVSMPLAATSRQPTSIVVSASAIRPPHATDPFLVAEPTQITRRRHGDLPTEVGRAESVARRDRRAEAEFNAPDFRTDWHLAAIDDDDVEALATYLRAQWEEHVWDDALLSLAGRDDNAGRS